MRDILRAHLFPEVTVKQNSQIKIMDIQQEILARNIGDGHRVIHGVAGSGKNHDSFVPLPLPDRNHTRKDSGVVLQHYPGQLSAGMH